MNGKSACVRLLAAPALFLSCLAGSRTMAQDPTVYVPYKNLTAWSAPTLYIGATFARMDSSPVRIWLKYNEAAMVGMLYFIEPGTNRRVDLFLNHSGWLHPLVLSDLANIPIGVPLTFGYEVFGQGTWHKPPTVEDRWPKYTGPNLPGDPFFSQASSDWHPDPSMRFGHRWSVAGRVNDSVVEFGFEDRVGEPTHLSDMDFDDIVFQVEGLKLVRNGLAARRRSYVW